VSKKTAEELHPVLLRFANGKGITLNPNKEFALDLIRGFLVNEERVGYRCCPCRLAVGDKDWDRDIICPCTYMMPDVKEFGTCFCSLYVSNEFAERVSKGDKTVHVSIPERRPLSKLDFPG
jgi:ferredoxin-thioredoxin reductase catalytic subunit